MEELIEYIAKSLASKPEEVKVTAATEEDRLILKLEVATEDKGKIIGRQGRVAQAMRTLAEDPARAEAMGRRGQALVRERCNWQAEERTLIALYERLLA